MNPIIFAIIAAVAFGLWTVFHRLAAPHVNQVIGAIIVSLVAVLLGGLVWLFQKHPDQYVTNWKGWLFLILAGLAAFLIDFFALKTYGSGLPVTIGGPIIIGGSIAIATLIGFLMGDSVTAIKLFGILLLASGAAILAMYQ
jgi:transporter family protein